MKEIQKKILVVDDDQAVRQSISDYLEDRDYIIYSAESGVEGLNIFKKEDIDLVLSDLRMPHMDGMELLTHIKAIHEETPVVIVSGIKDIDNALDAIHKGASDYITKPVEPLSILDHTLDKIFEKQRLIRENREYQKNLEKMVQERTRKLRNQNLKLEVTQRKMIGILSQAAEYRDFETGSHFLRVSEFTACIARELNMKKPAVVTIQLASPIHDIGKIGIPDSILLKPNRLNEEEWEEMKNHCQYGNNIIRASKFVERFYSIDEIAEEQDINDEGFGLISCAANVALFHHEQWNGKGYPFGLSGKEIPIEARITSVADVFDALSSKRPYKAAWPESDCFDYINEQKGKHFDPDIADAFMNRKDEIRQIMQRYED